MAQLDPCRMVGAQQREVPGYFPCPGSPGFIAAIPALLCQALIGSQLLRNESWEEMQQQPSLWSSGKVSRTHRELNPPTATRGAARGGKQQSPGGPRQSLQVLLPHTGAGGVTQPYSLS